MATFRLGLIMSFEGSCVEGLVPTVVVIKGHITFMMWDPVGDN